MTSKTELRRRMKSLRDAMTPAQRAAWSETIRLRVLTLPMVAEAQSVFCYVDRGSEVHTRPLMTELLARGVIVAVPRMVREDKSVGMEACRIQTVDDLVPGRWGIPEPPAMSPSQQAAPCDVALVPGLAFTRAGDRLGMGAGCYDRYLAAHPDTLAIGLCFEQQIVDHLPVESHDVPMRMVVTQGQDSRSA